jgi:hypothetical protein
MHQTLQNTAGGKEIEKGRQEERQKEEETRKEEQEIQMIDRFDLPPF